MEVRGASTLPGWDPGGGGGKVAGPRGGRVNMPSVTCSDLLPSVAACTRFPSS